MHDRVAAIDVHKDMVKVAVRVPGERRGTRKTDVLEFRTFYGVLEEMGRELRRRGVTHVVMEASGVYTEPVYYALAGLDFTEVMVINPAHAKALKGRKTDARDAIRLLDLHECGLLSGSCIPAPDLKEVRDLARYRILCRHRHSVRYAEARIMPSSRARCRPRVVAAVKPRHNPGACQFSCSRKASSLSGGR
jgi:transposase